MRSTVFQAIVIAIVSAAAAMPAAQAEVAAPTPATAATFEASVLAALCRARIDPTAMAAELTQIRGRYRGKLERMPEAAADVMTTEGVAPVDEAIGWLSQQRPVGGLADADLLRRSAGDHVADQRGTGGVGHRGRDGSMPWDRAARRGGGRAVAEMITYGSNTAEEVVAQLVVDDGVPDRGHRRLLYDPALRYAGVSCGPHPGYGTMCVIDLASTPDAH